MRLSHDVINYIKTVNLSYSEIITHVEKQWGRKISNGLVSYYRGKRVGRIKPFHKENVGQAEWDWLVGLYSADGCKFKDRGEYMAVFALSKNEQEILKKLLVILSKTCLKARVCLSKDNTFYVKVSSKQFYLALPSKNEPYSPQFPLAYLAGLMDGDGYMQKGRWIFSQAKHPHLVRQVLATGGKYGHITVMVQKPANDRKIPIYRVSFLEDTRRNLLKSDFAKYSTRCWSLLKSKEGPAGRI